MSSNDASRWQLTGLGLSNWRTIETADVTLGPLTVVTGWNGDGKSNLLDALMFMSDVATAGMSRSVAVRGGIDEVRNAAAKRSDPVEVRVTLHDCWSDDRWTYELALSCGRSRDPVSRHAQDGMAGAITDPARDQVARLMGRLGIRGVRREKKVRTTVADPKAARPADLADRDLAAERPSRQGYRPHPQLPRRPLPDQSEAAHAAPQTDHTDKENQNTQPAQNPRGDSCRAVGHSRMIRLDDVAVSGGGRPAGALDRLEGSWVPDNDRVACLDARSGAVGSFYSDQSWRGRDLRDIPSSPLGAQQSCSWPS